MRGVVGLLPAFCPRHELSECKQTAVSASGGWFRGSVPVPRAPRTAVLRGFVAPLRSFSSAQAASEPLPDSHGPQILPPLEPRPAQRPPCVWPEGRKTVQQSLNTTGLSTQAHRTSQHSSETQHTQLPQKMCLFVQEIQY